ncbi:MAG: ribosome small subunit-dependent GTPase A [Oscillospiraceae bacterium]|nr:ribosome small subunit-dependent GTPase A [Oscillospiraceae bacterium]
MLDLKTYGYTETQPQPDGLLPARITAAHKERYELVSQRGTAFGRLKTSAYHSPEPQIFPTVGDFVFIKEVEGGDCQIVETLPRRTYFARLDPNPNGGTQQAVAANIDYVFIMTSLNRDFSVGRVERYLVLARQSGATPIVILTKADLVADADMMVSQVKAIAQDIDVVPICALDGTGLDRIMEYLSPEKTVVFLGMSGVGKSSLLNALMGKEIMAVGDIREDDSRGRHTTTHRQLLMLPSGAMVVDTPGMRSIGMWGASDGLSETYADIEALLTKCRFSDCRHETEPGCAVLEAIENGELSVSRLRSYYTMQRESAYSEKRADYLRKKQEWGKSIEKYNRRHYKNEQHE